MRRVVALLAAYAIVLSGVIASFATARALPVAASTTAVICHSDGSGEPSPASNQDGGRACVDDCCVGCLMLTATVPPPPAIAVPLSQAIRQPFEAVQSSAAVVRFRKKSHLSQAPPFGA
jgi:hypothetical protein